MTEQAPSEHWLQTPSGKVRARGLGIAFDGTPAPFNSITDVPGVAVGYTTLIEGQGKLVTGKGPVRTGVTALLPRGRSATPCFAGCYSLNGNGEMTGTLWIDEIGELQTPITMTNTHSCGIARDATIAWMLENHLLQGDGWSLPVAAETYDGELNDINGFHVNAEHVKAALSNAKSGPIEQGSVGGGTGMCCYEFKAGSGSASRQVTIAGEQYTVAAFVQANFGLRQELHIEGKAVGRQLPQGRYKNKGSGSIIAIIATDAPLLPNQLKRLARRVPLGLARSGSIAHHSSGDIFLAFSTANSEALEAQTSSIRSIFALQETAIDPLFEAVVQSTEESIIDAMIVNQTMTGANDLTVEALPHQALMTLLRSSAW